MAKMKIDMEHGIFYECSECGEEVEIGQSYCQNCGEPLTWVEEEKMIKITLKNSQNMIWKKEEYDDYIYDGRFFIIIKGSQWIGFYNLDSIISVIIQN